MQNPCDPTHRKDSAAKTCNVLKLLKDGSVIYWLHFLMDVVSCLSQVSEGIQEQNISLADVNNELESARVILKKYTSSEGPYMKKADKKKDVMENTKNTFLLELIRCVNDRFEGDLHLFKGSYWTTFRNWPEQLTEELADFCECDVSELVNVCETALQRSDCETEVISTEWTRLKIELYNRMKIVKTNWLSSLSYTYLSDLLLIAVEGQDVGEFNPDSAISQWESSAVRYRKPFFNDSLKIKNIVHEQTVVVEENEEEGVEKDIDIAVDVFAMAEELDAISPIEDDGDEDDTEVLNIKDIQLLQNKAYRLRLDNIV